MASAAVSQHLAGGRVEAHRARLALLPPAVLLAGGFGAALIIFVSASFLRAGQPTLAHWRPLFTDGYYGLILWRTTWMSLVVTGITVVLSFPLAFGLARTRSWFVVACLGILLASNTMSLVTRALGWLGMLEANGPVNYTLLRVGLIHSPIRFIGEMSGVIIGLVHGFVPIMTIALLPVMQGIERDLEDAAFGLGAGRVGVFWRVTLPLSLRGTVAACCMVYAMCMGAFTTPAMLGGGRAAVFSELIQEQIAVTLDYGKAAALAILLLVIVLAVLWLGGYGARRRTLQAAQ